MYELTIFQLVFIILASASVGAFIGLVVASLCVAAGKDDNNEMDQR